MIPVRVKNVVEIRNPAFNFTLKAMNSYRINEGNDDMYKRMVKLAAKTCHSKYESDNMLWAIPLRGGDSIAIIEMEYPKTDEFVMVEVVLEEREGYKGTALIISVKDDV